MNVNYENNASLITLLLLVGLLFLSFLPAAALAGDEAYPFNKGRSRFSVEVSSTRAFNNSYTAVGLGVGYYVIDGLEVGLDGDAWFGNEPNIYRISPGLRYIIYSLQTVKPYAGVFYRRTFIENTEDQNEAGGRAGVTVMTGPRTNFSVGLVYDRRINCDKTIYFSCSETYSELSFAVLF